MPSINQGDNGVEVNGNNNKIGINKHHGAYYMEILAKLSEEVGYLKNEIKHLKEGK